VIDSYGAVWLTALANNWTGLNRLHDGEWAQYSVGPGVRGMEVYWLNGTPESDVVWFYSSGGVGSFSQRFDLNEKLYFPIIQ